MTGRRRGLGLLAGLVVAAASSVVAPTPTVAADGPSGFVGVAPQRIIDSRTGYPARAPQDDPFDQGGGLFTLRLESLAPAEATSVVINLTAVGPRNAWATAGPTTPGGHCPRASATALVMRDAAATMAIVGLDDELLICVDRSHDVVVDLVGWFVAGGGSTIQPVGPVRALDTRSGHGARLGPLVPFEVLEVDLQPLGVPAGATAALLNVTGISRGSAVYVVAFPCGGQVPPTSTVNVAAGAITPNAAIVGLAEGRRVCFVSNGNPDLVVDVSAWLAPGSGASFGAQQIATVRNGLDVAAGSTTVLDMATVGVDPGTTAVLVSTWFFAKAPGFVTLYPCSRPRPTTSVLNFTNGDAVVGTILVPLDADRRLCAYASAGGQLAVELTGRAT